MSLKYRVSRLPTALREYIPVRPNTILQLHRDLYGFSRYSVGGNDYEPFVKYYLGIMLKAYNELEIRAARLEGVIFTKAGRVRAVFDRKLGLIRKADIAALCPDISKTTIERALRDLLSDGYIYKVGAGRATGYVKK